MAIEINSQFSKFVQFAQNEMDKGNAKAVARMDTSLIDGNADMSARRIVSTNLDKVGAWRRREFNKNANDAVRALFRGAIIAMFGSADKIPAKVKTAMLMKDYGCGKPLTARRILAVQKAVAEAMEPTYASVSRNMAANAVAGAIDYANSHRESGGKALSALTPEQHSRAVNTLVKYGRGLTDKGLRLLANYVVNAAAANMNLEETAQAVLKHIAKFRDFKPGDARFATIDAAFKQNISDSLDDRLAEKNSFDKDGLFKTFHLDSSRSSYEIGGERLFGNDAAPKVVEGLKKLIPNPEHRKVISICMSQAVGLNVTCFAQRIALPGTAKSKAMELAGLKGIEMFMGFPSDDDVIDYYKAFKVNDPSYRIEVSKDGKTATVWAENEGDLRFAMTENDDVTRRIVGGFKWTQKFTFDLSDSSKATLIDAHVGQTIKL